MPYNFVGARFQIKKLCSRLSSSEVRFYTENGRFALSAKFSRRRGHPPPNTSARIDRPMDALLLCR